MIAIIGLDIYDWYHTRVTSMVREVYSTEKVKHIQSSLFQKYFIKDSQN